MKNKGVNGPIKFVEIVMIMISSVKGSLDLRTKFDLKFFSRILKTMDTQESFILLFSSEKLTRLFLLREV